MTNDKNNQLDIRNIEDLYAAFRAADHILLKKYIGILRNAPINSVPPAIKNIAYGDNLCLYHIDKIVYDTNENIQDKLTTVYSSLLAHPDNSLIMLVQGKASSVDLYMGIATRGLRSDNNKISTKSLSNAGNALKLVMEGNFPGTKISRINQTKIADNTDVPCVETILGIIAQKATSIASVSSIPALRNDNIAKNQDFIQGLEKLIDSMQGREYTALFIADVMDTEKINSICAEYEDIYAQLFPFKTSIQSISSSATDTESLIKGITDTTNQSLAKSLSHGTTSSDSFSTSVGIGISTEVDMKLFKSDININSTTTTGHSKGTSDTKTKTQTLGTAKSLTEQNSVANALTSGESLQLNYENKAISTLLDRIDEQIKRLRSCEDYGMFDCCSYFFSQSYDTTIFAASTYKSLLRGENSSVESSAINVWTDSTKIDLLKQYLLRAYHPQFIVNFNESKNNFLVTPSLLISGKELSYQFSLPKKSISGLPVLQCAEFGRNVMTTDGICNGELKIGKIYHMHKTEDTPVGLFLKDLTAHMFITGSTGAGKSNTIYQILSKVTKKTDSTFLVIEPAKGEYKHVFGNDPNFQVKVYGTNPYYTCMLRINPFRFPATTHIYEHMDRLVELFNVCWPMYAAMPAVLKVSLEHAYESVGWDLKTSTCNSSIPKYPSFAFVAESVRRYIDSSEYSDENKGNYKGALVTRLESLTNGINGMIFTSDDLEDHDLFDKNVIIDLSRVGSTETKSLIMGILIMRLQEYRSGSMAAPNSELRHITVLEEAHNLLKRTSTEQSSEGSNLLGKSVEMLANSIAEMRTYGESFIIADQAPGLLDMSVIRNTNTKVILRLPDYSDRELVGKSANLTDEQILELAKLPTGVAAVYQNNWISPVLCKFDRYISPEGYYCCPDNTYSYNEDGLLDADLMALDEFHNKLESEGLETAILGTLAKPNLTAAVRKEIFQFLNTKNDSSEKLIEALYTHFKIEPILNQIGTQNTIELWRQELILRAHVLVSSLDSKQIDSLFIKLLRYHTGLHAEYENIYFSYLQWLERKERVV